MDHQPYGNKERRILKGENKGVSVMGIEAVKDMLRKTKTDPKEIDVLIFATVTADMTLPATANIVATAVGAVNAYSYDISAACSGFLFALTTGASYWLASPSPFGYLAGGVVGGATPPWQALATVAARRAPGAEYTVLAVDPVSIELLGAWLWRH